MRIKSHAMWTAGRASILFDVFVTPFLLVGTLLASSAVAHSSGSGGWAAGMYPAPLHPAPGNVLHIVFTTSITPAWGSASATRVTTRFPPTIVVTSMSTVSTAPSPTCTGVMFCEQ